MTIKEMHVDIQAQLQRLASNRNRKLSPDQIDWYINSAQQALIQSAVSPVEGSGRFQIKPEKYDIVSALTSSRRAIHTSWINDRYVSFLPPDFWYLLDDASRVTQICKGESKVTTYSVLNLTRVRFPLSTLLTNFYGSVELIYNNSTLINLTSFLQERQKSYTGLKSKDEHFYVRELLMQFLIDQGIDVYWERFHDNYWPYHLIFVDNNASPIPIVLRVDGIDNTSSNQQLTIEIHSGTRQGILTPNTMVSSDKGTATSNTPYFKTSYISPVSEQGPSVLYTYSDKSFIVFQSSVSYIRKPRMVSLSLGTDCQLSPSIHQTVCNKTVELILSRIAAEQPDWETVAKQNAVSNS